MLNKSIAGLIEGKPNGFHKVLIHRAVRAVNGVNPWELSAGSEDSKLVADPYGSLGGEGDRVRDGGFKDFLFSPLLGKMIQIDLRIFFKWVETTNQLHSGNLNIAGWKISKNEFLSVYVLY